jgi:hypothetical protein
MSADSTSHARPIGVQEGEYVVRSGTIASSYDALPYHPSSTWKVTRLAKDAVLPILVGMASFGAPVTPGVRRVFSGAAISRSAVCGVEWLLDGDEFYFTEEAADIAEVRALNALLNLPLSTGLEIEFPE